MHTFFQPTGRINDFGKYGVYQVKTDGSIQNGLELCTVGRRLDFLDLFVQYDNIINVMMMYEPNMYENAGLHNHVLFDYSDSYTCLEKPVPGIIFKNFCQLLRRYAPALVWLTSTVYHEGEDYITRMDYFCKGEELMRYTPINRTAEKYDVP
jgi:hypothetical protein